MRSNSSDSSKRENLQQARKKRRNKTQFSMAEAIVQEAQILDQCERDATKLNNQRERDLAKDLQEIQQLRFQAEMRQRDQYHKFEILRQ